MKKFILFVIIFAAVLSANLAACSPQVTVTLTPPPIATPVPAKETPTPESPPTETAISGLSPEQIAARIAEINSEFRGFYEVNADGQFYAINQATGETTFHPEFGFRADTGDLTWTHYSELLGRELTEPVADLHMEYKVDPKTNKTVYTGAFSIQGCNFDGKQCNPDMVLDPVTGKEVAQAHSIFEVMMLQLQDMALMSEQDKIDAYDFSQDYFDKLLAPNKGSRSLRYVDKNGVEHVWPLYFPGGTGRTARYMSNQIHVEDEGLLRGVPHFIVEGIGSDGRVGFVIWEVGVGTENHERREVFIDDQGITNFDWSKFNSESAFEINKEWLPGEYELIPFD